MSVEQYVRWTVYIYWTVCPLKGSCPLDRISIEQYVHWTLYVHWTVNVHWTVCLLNSISVEQYVRLTIHTYIRNLSYTRITKQHVDFYTSYMHALMNVGYLRRIDNNPLWREDWLSDPTLETEWAEELIKFCWL